MNDKSYILNNKIDELTPNKINVTSTKTLNDPIDHIRKPQLSKLSKINNLKKVDKLMAGNAVMFDSLEPYSDKKMPLKRFNTYSDSKVISYQN